VVQRHNVSFHYLMSDTCKSKARDSNRRDPSTTNLKVVRQNRKCCRSYPSERLEIINVNNKYIHYGVYTAASMTYVFLQSPPIRTSQVHVSDIFEFTPGLRFYLDLVPYQEA
jgi:hypothetical protein